MALCSCLTPFRRSRNCETGAFLAFSPSPNNFSFVITSLKCQQQKRNSPTFNPDEIVLFDYSLPSFAPQILSKVQGKSSPIVFRGFRSLKHPSSPSFTHKSVSWLTCTSRTSFGKVGFCVKYGYHL